MSLGRVCSVFVFAALSGSTLAQDKTAKWMSDDGTKIFIAAGLLSPLIRDGSDGFNHFARTGEALVISTGVTYLIKKLTRVRRPDGNGNDSFPSGHASAAFTIAAMQSGYHPSESPLWYGGAAAIGWSRVELGRHSLTDVAVGALIGFGAAQLELGHNDGILISPFLTKSGKPGLNLRIRF